MYPNSQPLPLHNGRSSKHVRMVTPGRRNTRRRSMRRRSRTLTSTSTLAAAALREAAATAAAPLMTKQAVATTNKACTTRKKRSGCLTRPGCKWWKRASLAFCRCVALSYNPKPSPSFSHYPDYGPMFNRPSHSSKLSPLCRFFEF